MYYVAALQRALNGKNTRIPMSFTIKNSITIKMFNYEVHSLTVHIQLGHTLLADDGSMQGPELGGAEHHPLGTPSTAASLSGAVGGAWEPYPSREG